MFLLAPEAMVMCFPMTKEVSQRTLAMGLFGLSFVAAREARVTQAQEASTAACQRGIDAEAAPEDILQAGAQKALLHATEHVAFVRLCCAVLC